jgi:hypothetical protein
VVLQEAVGRDVVGGGGAAERPAEAHAERERDARDDLTIVSEQEPHVAEAAAADDAVRAALRGDGAVELRALAGEEAGVGARRFGRADVVLAADDEKVELRAEADEVALRLLLRVLVLGAGAVVLALFAGAVEADEAFRALKRLFTARAPALVAALGAAAAAAAAAGRRATRETRRAVGASPSISLLIVTLYGSFVLPSVPAASPLSSVSAKKYLMSPVVVTSSHGISPPKPLPIFFSSTDLYVFEPKGL